MREVTKRFKKERLDPDVAVSPDGLDPQYVVALWDQALNEVVESNAKEAKKKDRHSSDEKVKKGKQRDDATDSSSSSQHGASSSKR